MGVAIKMKFFYVIFMLTILTTNYCNCYDILRKSHQLLIVTTNHWNEKQANLQLYERVNTDANWTAVGNSIPVVLGQGGLAWGIILHPATTNIPLKKMEGDKKSPAGIFSLGKAFGLAPNSEIKHLKIDYLYLDEYTEAVDDPMSDYYNHIVSNKDVIVDWNSSEKMNKESLYKMGIVINHNFPNPQPAAGSAIFFHIWRKKRFFYSRLYCDE
jgi:D-alanyl-D-alanine dipeptidase